jgi:hypothetical protein
VRAGLNFTAQITASEMLDTTCPDCNRLWAEYSEVIQKTFRLEERLSQAKLRQDHEQVKALAGRLATLADSQVRLGQELTEHVGRAHSTR